MASLLVAVSDSPFPSLDPALQVLAELDGERRQDLLQRVAALPQAMVTAADIEMFGADFRGKATVWHVQAGALRPGLPETPADPV